VRAEEYSRRSSSPTSWIQILVSETTRVLAGGTGLEFEDRGTHELKGLDGEWRLFAFVRAERVG
jgi:class 3 adenylate cyclase